MIINALHDKKLPVYGKGINVRDWLYVEDHAEAIDLIFHKAEPGSTYNIGGNNEWKNIDLIKKFSVFMLSSFPCSTSISLYPFPIFTIHFPSYITYIQITIQFGFQGALMSDNIIHVLDRFQFSSLYIFPVQNKIV